MKKSDVSRQPSYFDTYINKVDDIEPSEAFAQSITELDAIDLDKLHQLGDQVYAPGKWTIRDIIQHLADCERVFCYRALSVGRGDTTPLPSFDENIFAENTGANTRPLEDVLAEFRLVRQGSIALFKTFDEAALRRTGQMSRYVLPVLAVAYIIVGHQRHHFDIIAERYLPLLNKG